MTTLIATSCRVERERGLIANGHRVVDRRREERMYRRKEAMKDYQNKKLVRVLEQPSYHT